MGTAINVRVDQEKASRSKKPIAEIDLDEFQKARQNAKVNEFLDESAEYGKQLEKDGRIKR